MYKKVPFLCAIVVGIGVGAIAGAEIIHVPGDSPTIQIAIEKALPGDTIVVAPGTYFEAINFGGKTITVRSSEPIDPSVVADTIIDAGGLGVVVTFTGGEDENSSILDGFTITGGTIGIDGHSTRAIIRRCVVRDNASYGIRQADGTIEDSQILNNNSYGLHDCDGTIQRCVIGNNSSRGLSDCDGTILDSTVERNGGQGISGGSVDVIRCVVASNSTGVYSHAGDIQQSFIVGNRSHGIDGFGFRDAGLIRNTVLAGNRQHGIYQSDKNVLNCTVAGNAKFGFYSHRGSISHCVIWNNSEGALTDSTTPLFSGTGNPFFFQAGFWDEVNGAWVNFNYHLMPNSPYIDAGDPNYPDDPNATTQDIEGNPRVLGMRVDIGAYEFGGACEGPDFDGDETPDVCDGDIDDDGIANLLDVCDHTPPGIAVDEAGRPLADANKDCIVDLRDFAILQRDMFWPE